MSAVQLATLEPVSNGQKRSAKRTSARKSANTLPKAPRPINRQDRLTIAVASAAACTTVVVSMALNVWAFTRIMDSALGVSVGLLLPLWVLALTYQGQRIHSRSPYTAAACYALAAFLLAVSLHHLADGYAQIVPTWEGWALAVVTDLLQVASKVVIIRIVRR